MKESVLGIPVHQDLTPAHLKKIINEIKSLIDKNRFSRQTDWISNFWKK